MAEHEDLVRDLQEELSDLRSLKGHRGWKRFQEVVEKQVENRKVAHFHPAENLEDILRSEFQKGEIAFGELIRVLVDLRIDTLIEEIGDVGDAD